jgi:hypothetical protein
MKLLEHLENSGKTLYDMAVTSAPWSYVGLVTGAWLEYFVPSAGIVELLPWIVGLMLLDTVVGVRVAHQKGEFEFRKLVWRVFDKTLGYLVVAGATVWLAKFAVGKEASHTLLWGVAMAVAATELVSALKHAKALGVARGVIQPIEERLKGVVKGDVPRE